MERARFGDKWLMVLPSLAFASLGVFLAPAAARPHWTVYVEVFWGLWLLGACSLLLGASFPARRMVARVVGGFVIAVYLFVLGDLLFLNIVNYSGVGWIVVPGTAGTIACAIACFVLAGQRDPESLFYIPQRYTSPLAAGEAIPSLGKPATSETVRVRKSVGIFASSYLLLLYALGLGMFALGMRPYSNISTPVLLVASIIAACLFARRYGRIFNAVEYRRILAGSVMVDIAVQILLVISARGTTVPPASILGIAVLVMVVHAVLLAAVYSSLRCAHCSRRIHIFSEAMNTWGTQRSCPHCDGKVSLHYSWKWVVIFFVPGVIISHAAANILGLLESSLVIGAYVILCMRLKPYSGEPLPRASQRSPSLAGPLPRASHPSPSTSGVGDMLREIQHVHQVPGEPLRRWFTSNEFDLYVWCDDSGKITAFQLCYDKAHSERAFTWKRGVGSSHHAVDDGEGRAFRHKASPIFVADGYFNSQGVADRLAEAGGQLPREILELVLNRLRQPNETNGDRPFGLSSDE